MKLFRITLILLFLVMSMGLVSAQDNLNDTIQANVLASDDVGSFEELEYDIIDANGTLEITKDYRNDNYPDGITIGKDNLVINGNNHTIDGSGQRIFIISSSSNITINNLIFINAYSDDFGSALGNGGIATLNNVTFVNNGAVWGGAIGNGGTVTLNNVSFVDNCAESGGAIYNWGVVELCSAVFINNSAGGGGAILNIATVTLNNVSFVDNSADDIGGAIANSGDMELYGAVFVDNVAAEDGGGAIYNMGTVTLNNVSFVDNCAEYGGAITNSDVAELCDAVFVDNCAESGGGIYNTGTLTLNDVSFADNIAVCGGAIYDFGVVELCGAVFVDNVAAEEGGAIYDSGVMWLCGAVFIDNSAEYGGAIRKNAGGELSISNSSFTSKISDKLGQISCINSNVVILNSTFLNITSSYSPALYVESSNVSISNSRFVNLTADITAGAIAIRGGGNHYIEGCEFINTSSSKNAGALFIDISGSDYSIGDVVIEDTLFEDTYSEFGGAIIQLGGSLCVINSDFIDNGATYKGGSVYLSFVDDAEIDNCTFDSNGIKSLENITTCGSAIYCDISNLALTNSRVINKSKDSGSAVYVCDSSYTIANSIFMDNTNAIYTDFDRASSLVNNIYGNGSVSTNNTYGTETIMVGEGMQLKLLNNSINVTDLPSRFDLRDWNWTSPVGDQGEMSACWAFSATEALESALRRACGITTPFSINNMQNIMMRYSNYGTLWVMEGGFSDTGPSYLVSWLGAFPQDYDTYDEVGKISPIITTDENIHIQDLIYAPNSEPGSVEMKSAILKYGSLSASVYLNINDMQYINPETNAQYVNDNISYCHDVEIIGWDDNYPKENFLIAPPGDGAWISKNSWGTDWGDNGYMYLSYYDKSLLRVYADDDGNVTFWEVAATGVIVENTVPYNKNYQYDLWNGYFDFYGATYANVFEALDDDLIAAVGTYFFMSDVDYRVDVYVNGELKLSQEGLSPYSGFHTIKLDEYVPIKAGDVFSAAITSNAIPISYLEDTRIHYTPGLSYKFENGSWIDLYDEGMIACVKVYTVADERHNTTLIAPDRVIGVNDAIYGYDYQFILKDENGTALANKEVLVSFNGENQTVVTDENGWGTVNVKANAEGTYTVEIIFRGSNDCYGISQNATIKLIRQKTAFVAPDRVVYVRDISNGYQYSAILKDNYGKALANKKVLFIFDGKKQVAYTDENGWATVTLNADTAGVQTVTIKFAGDRCYRETVITKTVKVVRESSILTTVNKEFVVSDNDKKVTATLKSKSGNPIYGAKVTFAVDGKTYSAITGDDGVATFSIDLFKLGTFHASTRFEDSRFYAATTTTSKVIIY